jgi:hypothetical protein
VQLRVPDAGKMLQAPVPGTSRQRRHLRVMPATFGNHAMIEHIHLTRRGLLAGAAAFVAARADAQARSTPVPVEVWKDEGCGCCQDWISHLEANGFQVTVHEGGNQTVRTRLGIAPKYSSCHTGVVAGYALEGHVPAREIRRLLQDKPQAIGLAVPGMPVGSPGMDGPAYGGRRDPFEVLLLARGGGARVFQRYAGNRQGGTA